MLCLFIVHLEILFAKYLSRVGLNLQKQLLRIEVRSCDVAETEIRGWRQQRQDDNRDSRQRSPYISRIGILYKYSIVHELNFILVQ